MKKLSLILFVSICFASLIKAQTSTENICSAVKKVNQSISVGDIFVFGEVFRPQIVKPDDKELTLSQSIAITGGFSRKAFTRKIQIVRCSADFTSVKNTEFVNYREIVTGKKSDPKLQGSEIIYIPKKKKPVLDLTLINPNLISENRLF